jgi:hypothetical protein
MFRTQIEFLWKIFCALVSSVSKFCSKTRIKRIKNIKSLYPIEHQCCGSVTWHGKDPDPRIRTTDLRISILLFSSLTDKILTKNTFFSDFFAYYFLKVYLHQLVDVRTRIRMAPKHTVLILRGSESGSTSLEHIYRFLIFLYCN